jgi:tripartite-type tricarboxylate transporter receptor subunit TctC
MSTLRLAIHLFATYLIVMASGSAIGQDYPSKVVRIFTSQPGGGSDFTARFIAQGISGSLGQPVIVENRGSSVIAAEIVSKAPSDGYSLLSWGNTLWIGALLDKTPYDPMRDFTPVSLVGKGPHMLVVHRSLPLRSVKELVALAKARPGELNYASTSAGSPLHLAGELLKSMAGVNIVRVNYKSTGPAIIGILSGEAQLMFPNVNAGMPHVKTGKLAALAVTTAQPSSLAPGLPTIASAGFPGYEIAAADSILGPAKMSPAVLNRLSQEITRFLRTPEAREKLLATGTEVVGSTPDELAAVMKSDTAILGKVIKDAGIKAESAT